MDPESSSAYCSSAGPSRKLSRTAIAPTLVMAKYASQYSLLLYIRIPTRSPGRYPKLQQRIGIRATTPPELRKRQWRLAFHAERGRVRRNPEVWPSACLVKNEMSVTDDD